MKQCRQRRLHTVAAHLEPELVQGPAAAPAEATRGTRGRAASRPPPAPLAVVDAPGRMFRSFIDDAQLLGPPCPCPEPSACGGDTRPSGVSPGNKRARGCSRIECRPALYPRIARNAARLPLRVTTESTANAGTPDHGRAPHGRSSGTTHPDPPARSGAESYRGPVVRRRGGHPARGDRRSGRGRLRSGRHGDHAAVGRAREHRAFLLRADAAGDRGHGGAGGGGRGRER